MAPPEGKPPDKADLNFFKCHKKKSVSIVMCIICGGVYDQSCFERLQNTKFVGERLAICPDHNNITSNYDDTTQNEETRKLFAQIRLSIVEEVREEVLREIQEEDNSSSVSSKQDARDTQGIELSNLKSENKLLRLLNKELLDKNTLLKEHLVLVKQIKNEPKIKAYSQILIDEIPAKKRIPKIIIKKKNRADVSDLRSKVTHYLNKEKTIQTKKVIFKSDSEVIISCMNETSVAETEKSLSKELANMCSIEKEEVKKPRLKVIGIDNYEGMDLKSLEEDINARNFKNFESKCTVVHTYVNKKTNLQSVILEASAEIYKHIRESKNRIFIGYQNCKVFDDLNIQPCFNCGRFGHNGNKCRNDKVCLKCAGTHNSINCNKADEICCVNCLYSNNKYNLQYNTRHLANDSKCCQVLINKINKYIASTDYPMSPIYQRFIGKIDISKNTGVIASNRQNSVTSPSTHSSLLAGQKIAASTR